MTKQYFFKVKGRGPVEVELTRGQFKALKELCVQSPHEYEYVTPFPTGK